MKNCWDRVFSMIESITAFAFDCRPRGETRMKPLDLVDETILQIVLEHYLQRQIGHLIFAQDFSARFTHNITLLGLQL